MLSLKMKKKLKEILADDICGSDVTSALVPERKCRAKIVAKESCTIAGLEEVKFLFKSNGVNAGSSFRDGERVRKHSVILKLAGKNQTVFSIERTALNILGRMSGVATVCAEAKKIAKKNATVAATRKTMPGFNVFDKKAAKSAGIWPHRLNLNEFVLLKDNHLPFFKSPFEAVVAARKKYGSSKKIEVEVDTLQQAFDAAGAKPEIIMLDNFSPAKARGAVKNLRKVFKGKIELSGGITLCNLKQYSAAKPDLISMGGLTHSVKSCDFALDLIK